MHFSTVMFSITQNKRRLCMLCSIIRTYFKCFELVTDFAGVHGW